MSHISASESFCREQEALQLAKAASEILENRRKIALTAAKAWSVEAVLAAKRELKQRSLDKLDTEIALEFRNEAVTDASHIAEPPLSGCYVPLTARSEGTKLTL